MKRIDVFRGSDAIEKVGIDQKLLEPHVADVGQGPVVFLHGGGIAIGEAIFGDVPRIGLYTYVTGCGCGCNAPGKGVVVTPQPDHARLLGQTLIKLADEFEARAERQAVDVLAKASGK